MAADKVKYLQSRIARLFELADRASDYELKAELACYAAVLTSGLIESSLRKFCLEYASKRSSVEVSHYVESQLYYFQNAKFDRIEVLLRAFSAELFQAVNASLVEEEIAAIDSVINNKNSLAHGSNAGLSLEVMRSYFSLVVSALPKIRKMLT